MDGRFAVRIWELVRWSWLRATRAQVLPLHLLLRRGRDKLPQGLRSLPGLGVLTLAPQDGGAEKQVTCAQPQHAGARGERCASFTPS